MVQLINMALVLADDRNVSERSIEKKITRRFHHYYIENTRYRVESGFYAFSNDIEMILSER